MQHRNGPSTDRFSPTFRPIGLVALLLMLVGLGGCVTSDLLNERAERNLAGGDLAMAEENLARSEARRPAHWRTQWLIGELRMRQGRPVDAEVAFRRAWSMKGNHPETPEILDLIAESILAQGEDAHGKLRAFLFEAIDQYGTSYDYVRQGRFLMEIQDMDGAKVAFNKAIVTGRGTFDARTHLALAEFHRRTGDQRKEISSLRHVLFLDEENQTAANRLRELGFVPGPAAGLAPPLRPLD
ncbi:MAG: hypothetical protein JJU36_02435 [Phycisphaeraceae bacterium]|nr:hypothetical protein [Phycisphaeraceae bacterium]